jgi:hypothetical protein
VVRNNPTNLARYDLLPDIDVERMKAAFAALASFEPSTRRSMQVADHRSAA